MPDVIILNQQNEVHNHILRDLKLPLSRPQINHLELLVSGVIGCSDKRTISNIVRSSVSQRDRSCTQKFLNYSSWDEHLLNLRRKQYAANKLEKELETTGSPLFAILDDTINAKNTDSRHIEGLGFNYSHSSGNQEWWSHNVQGLHCIVGNLLLPFDFELYLKKKYCEQTSNKFMSKVDISIQLLKGLDIQSRYPTYFLTDSWYTFPKLINEAATLGYHTIRALKSNRIFYPAGIRQSLSGFIQYITDSDLDIVTVKGKKYKVYRYEGKMNGLENAVILITWDNASNSEPKYFLCSDVSLDSKTIMEYYSKRCEIETSFRYLKDRLGFDRYQMRSMKAIKRFWLVQYIAYGYIELYRYKNNSIFRFENLGATIDHIKAFNMKNIVDYVYSCGKQEVDIATVYKVLKLTS